MLKNNLLNYILADLRYNILVKNYSEKEMISKIKRYHFT